MPNQTLYDNFSQVRQYIDQEKPDLSSYVTKTELSNCSYVTSADLPVINENILPKETGTYTLGDSSYIYSTSYITDMWLNGTNKFSNRNNTQINLMLNNAWKYVFHANNFSPANDNTINLGESSVRWGNTYTTNVYCSNIVLSYSYNWIRYASNTQIDFGVNGYNRARLTNTTFCPSTNNGIHLGTASNQWNRTYTGHLYLNGVDIEDRFTYLVWTGTAAEYTALSDYTTYQFYLIENE